MNDSDKRVDILPVPKLWKQSVAELKNYLLDQDCRENCKLTFNSSSITVQVSRTLEKFLLNDALNNMLWNNIETLDEEGAEQLFEIFKEQNSNISPTVTTSKKEITFIIEKCLVIYASIIQNTINIFGKRETKPSQSVQLDLHNSSDEETKQEETRVEAINIPSVTPTKGLQSHELNQLGCVNIRLPFDVEQMIRNAEWIDVKPSNVFQVGSAVVYSHNSSLHTSLRPQNGF